MHLIIIKSVQINRNLKTIFTALCKNRNKHFVEIEQVHRFFSDIFKPSQFALEFINLKNSLKIIVYLRVFLLHHHQNHILSCGKTT